MNEVRESGHATIQDRFTWIETDALIRFFLYYMSMEQRRQIMGRYPVIYAKLFPGVSRAAINEAVDAELAKVD